MLHFDKKLVANNKDTHAKWWGEVEQARHFADSEEARVMSVNSAAILPRDVWRQMDTTTTELLRGDGGSAFMDDLMPLATSVNIGKMVVLSRAASDAGTVTVSLTGQVGTPTDKTDYSYSGAVIPIFSSSYHRNFREMEALRSEGFNALVDDQYNTAFNLRKRMAGYVMDGDAGISIEGYKGQGIRTNPASKAINLGSAAGGAGIDLTTADADAILAFFQGPFAAMLDDNFITAQVNLYVSPGIKRNFEKNLSQADGFKGGTIERAILEKGRIAAIKRTYELTGNEFFGFVPDRRFIRPVIGMAMSTVAIPRHHPRANYVFDVWAAMGLEIKADYNGRSGVFHSVAIN